MFTKNCLGLDLMPPHKQIATTDTVFTNSEETHYIKALTHDNKSKRKLDDDIARLDIAHRRPPGDVTTTN